MLLLMRLSQNMGFRSASEILWCRFLAPVASNDTEEGRLKQEGRTGQTIAKTGNLKALKQYRNSLLVFICCLSKLKEDCIFIVVKGPLLRHLYMTKTEYLLK